MTLALSVVTFVPFKNFSNKCIQYSQREICMADAKLTNRNIATITATERKKFQKLRNLIICASKH